MVIFRLRLLFRLPSAYYTSLQAAELKRRALGAQEAEEDADRKASFVEAEVHKVGSDRIIAFFHMNQSIQGKTRLNSWVTSRPAHLLLYLF